MTTRTRTCTLTGAFLAAGLGIALAGPAGADPHDIPGTAGAETYTGATEEPRRAFYEPPASIPSTPGTVIREEPATSVLDPLDLSSKHYTSKRVMYSSKDREGNNIAVTGIVITPKSAWRGTGKRPLISYAAGTQGMADRCAPTRFLSDSFEYESLFFSGLLSRGYSVALTDYQGLGTPGTHTYMNRQVQGQVVLDMARAAQRLPGSGVPADGPVGITGYSQGGGAASSAAELHSSYAPELDLKGTVAGAVPADLAKVGTNLDGGMYAAFLYYAAIGVSQGYHTDMSPYLNAKGKEMLPKVENSCVTDLFQFSFTKSSDYTADGRSLGATMEDEPFRTILADNRIGKRTPSAPVLLTHSLLDDTIPYSVGKQLARDWCGRGADVRWSANLGPAHVGGMIPHSAEALPWFDARFKGTKQRSNCWAVR